MRYIMGSVGVVVAGVVGSVAIATSTPVSAQTEYRRGAMGYEQMMRLQEQPTTVSSGTLIQLRNDPFFKGNFSRVVNDAAAILAGYTIVVRGGFFPENEGIPPEQQLTNAQVVYRAYTLADGDELILFRSPRVDTAQYFIRRFGRSQPTERQRLG